MRVAPVPGASQPEAPAHDGRAGYVCCDPFGAYAHGTLSVFMHHSGAAHDPDPAREAVPS